jgi:hypothetical protein
VRIASSPTLRIAAGLLVALLLSVVGFQVFRRLNSHGPEAMLERADDLSWHNSAVSIEPSYVSIQQVFYRPSVARHVTAASTRRREPVNAQFPRASHDSIVDLLLTPDHVQQQSTLSRHLISSH